MYAVITLEIDGSENTWTVGSMDACQEYIAEQTYSSNYGLLYLGRLDTDLPATPSGS